MNRIYIAGPMSGKPKFNHDAFTEAWNFLTQRGYGAVSPHFLESTIEIESRVAMGKGQMYRYALPIDIFAVSSVDAVVALPGWETSAGCGFERHAADLMEIPWVAPDFDSDEYEGELRPYLEQCLSILERTL